MKLIALVLAFLLVGASASAQSIFVPPYRGISFVPIVQPSSASEGTVYYDVSAHAFEICTSTTCTGSGWTIVGSGNSLPTGVATGQVLRSNGVGASPVYTASPSVTSLTLAAGGSLTWTGRSIITSSADGVVQVTNNAGTGITGFVYGPSDATTNGFSFRVAAGVLSLSTGDGSTFHAITTGKITVGDGGTGGGIFFGNNADLNITAASRFLWNGQTIFTSSADGKVTITNNGATAGVGLDVTSNGVLAVRNTAQNADATIRAASYSLALASFLQANQTARSSSGGTFVMMGIGADTAGSGTNACSITPTSTGRIIFTISGNIVNNTTATTVTIKMAENTGTAPANNASATGNVITSAVVTDGLTTALTVPFSITGIKTGLALATAVWFDLQLTTSTTNTGQPTNITCVANEI